MYVKGKNVQRGKTANEGRKKYFKTFQIKI